MVKKDNKFSEYPESMDLYFRNNDVRILKLPNDITESIETAGVTIKISSAKQYINYINNEIQKWDEKDPLRKLKKYSLVDKMEMAQKSFHESIRYYDRGDIYNGNYCLNQSISNIKQGHLNSNTKLAKFLQRTYGKGDAYITGFMLSLSKDRNKSLSNTVESIEGFVAGLSYMKTFQNVRNASSEEIDSVKDAVSLANDSFTRLNESYTMSFHEQERRIQELAQITQQQIEELKNKETEYFEDKEKRCADLEKLYSEKLKLQAPAKYWTDVEQIYRKRGGWWLVASGFLAAALIVLLLIVLMYLPNLFSEDSHWFDIFKNSAILTIIASIGVYLLRYFMKLCTSSYHLSRDAKERENLSIFYLALIEKGAVTEKERAIILNALFSRSETGLLKGDTTPVMSNNVVELVENLKK